MGTNEITAFIVFVVAALLAVWKKFTGSSDSAPGNTGNSQSSPYGPETGINYEPVTNPEVDFVGGSLENAPLDVRRWSNPAKKWANLYGLPWQIVLAQIWTESAGDEEAIGSAGEIGLMQLKDIAVLDIQQLGYDVASGWRSSGEANIANGTAFLDLQRRRSDGNVYEALRSYNQGHAGKDNRPQLANEYANKVVNRAKKLGYNG